MPHREMGAEVTAEAVNNAHYAEVMPSWVNIGRMNCDFNLCCSSISFWVEQNNIIGIYLV